VEVMSTLAPNASIGRTEPPDDAALSEALGATKSIWDGLIAKLDAEYGVSVREWKSYSAKSGWSLRLLKKKRTIVWMVPCDHSFRVAFIFGDKAVAAVAESGLPQKILTMLDEAEKYREGTGLRLQIKSTRDIPTVLKLTELKLKW
jgi:hypothetical protein